MENNKILYTIAIYSENQIGLLSAISNIFVRHGLNIESLTACPSALEGIHKITVTTHCDLHRISVITRQIEKRIDVVKAFLYTDDDLFFREVALYKVPTENLLNYAHFEDLIERNAARILEINRKFTIIQKTGQDESIHRLYVELQQLGAVLQFARSGRIAVTNSDRELVTEFLQQRQHDQVCKKSSQESKDKII